MIECNQFHSALIIRLFDKQLLNVAQLWWRNQQYQFVVLLWDHGPKFVWKIAVLDFEGFPDEYTELCWPRQYIYFLWVYKASRNLLV